MTSAFYPAHLFVLRGFLLETSWRGGDYNLFRKGNGSDFDQIFYPRLAGNLRKRLNNSNALN